uniref:Uncharacterized protein n=1 Tax=Antonospora locustae TaxID=278021 RepID=Q6E6D3_ANTLO|nr:hypothetical protein [Antonospora locustae]
MFDAAYFSELLNETMLLSESLSRKHCEETAERLEANVLALSYLAESIEDAEERAETKKKLALFSTAFELQTERRREVVASETDEGREALEGDLLEHARQLRQKANELGRKLREDDQVVERVGNVFQKNVLQTRANLVNANALGDTVSVLQVFMLSFVIFLLMYIFVRFF